MRSIPRYILAAVLIAGLISVGPAGSAQISQQIVQQRPWRDFPIADAAGNRIATLRVVGVDGLMVIDASGKMIYRSYRPSETASDDPLPKLKSYDSKADAIDDAQKLRADLDEVGRSVNMLIDRVNKLSGNP